MRLPALTMLIAAATVSPAAAQTDPFDVLHAENRLAAEQDLARQQALAAGREAFAAERRARSAAALQTLRASRIAAQTEPPPPAPLDARMAADAETIARLRGEALARSNARILAIKPASED